MLQPARRFSRTLHSRRFAAAAAALAAALLLAGCSESGSSDAASGPRTTLEYASMKDIRDINPHLYLGEMAAQAMVFEPLVANTPEGVKPLLAERWDISPDGRTYTFHLRKDVRYSDGEPFTAASVKANIDAILENRVRHAWIELVNQIESNEAVDEHTWRLVLKQPYFPTLIELGVTRPFRFISPKCMKDGHTKDGVTCLAGTGPWRLAEHKRNQYAVFEANSGYWGERPKLERVRWRVMPDPQTMLMALEKREIDLVFGADGDQLTTDAISKLQKEKRLAVELSSPIASRAVLLNTARPVTGDPAVREAIQRAINRDAIVKGILNNIEIPADTLFAKSVPYCGVDLPSRPYDPTAASKLLDEAGWTLGSDGVRVKNGVRCEAVFSFNSQNAQERTIAEAIQADLARIGIAVALQGEEKQTFLDRQRSGNFDLQYALSWGAPYDPQSYFSSWRTPAHGDFQAQSGLSEKARIDEEIGRFLVEPDEAKRQALAADILQTVHRAAVYFPLSYSRTKAVHSMALQNVGFAVSQYEIPFEAMQFSSPNAPAGNAAGR